MTDLYKHGQRIIIAPQHAVPFTACNHLTVSNSAQVLTTRVSMDEVQYAEFFDATWPTTDEHVKQTIHSAAGAWHLHITRDTNARITIAEPGSTVLLILVAEGVHATLTITHTHDQHAAQLVRAITNTNASLTLQHTSSPLTHYIGYRQSRQHAGSHVEWSGIPTVSDYARVEHHTLLLGSHASAHQHTNIHAHNDAHYDISLSSTHAATSTTSTIDGRAVASDNAKILLRGSLLMHSHSEKSTGQQSLRILTTSTHAEADAIPQLDIRNHDVTCSHRAFVKGISPDDLFTLIQRGIAPHLAKDLIINGFLEGAP